MQNYQAIFQLIILLPLLSFNAAQGADTPNETTLTIRPNIALMLEDIQALSSEQYEGRQTGTIGGQHAADFVLNRFEQLGLTGGEQDSAGTNRSWIQQQPLSVTTFPHPTIVTFSASSKNQEHTIPTIKVGSDFLPILDSPSVNVTAPVVFVGYGIDDPARGVNDYEGLDVQNRIVMFLRGKPTTYSQWVTHEEKEHTARRHGAAGFITLTGPILNRYEARRGMGQTPLAMYSTSPDERPLPGAWISGDVGQKLFASQGRSLKDIQTQLNKGKNLSTRLGILTHLQWDSSITPGQLINVVGMVPGNDAVLRKEIILIGAHRDHFGKQAGLLFAGADDNASGTALLLEIARIMVEKRSQLKRTIVFVSFDGEERGLLGSKHYINHPSHPLNNIVAMINVDHVGVGNGKLTVGLTRLPKSIGEQAANLGNLTDKIQLYGYFPGGDHVPFYEAEVPTATVVSSGKHLAFHQSSDTAETIQPEILEDARRYVLALTWLLVNR